MKQTYLLFILFLVSFHSISQESSFFENPVIRGDMADPSVIRVGDTYYATGTSSEWAPFYPIYRSTDLINWEQQGHVFDEKPAWTSHSFWAPELFYHDNTMFCYYTARRKTDSTSYIGVASAEGTSLLFRDHGPIVEMGTEAIDAFIFDDDGQLYLTWKAYGLDRRPIELLAARLSADGLRLEGEPFSLLTDDEGIGLEGQYHFKRGDYYYILYSAKSCCGPGSDYDVRVARSGSFRGSYEKYEENPILSGGEGEYISCGHGTVVDTPDGRTFFLSHGYRSGDAFFLGRQPILHELEMTGDGWVRFTTGKQAANRQQAPFAGTVQQEIPDFRDDFYGKELKVNWTWNYPYADMEATLKNGKLILGGKPVAGNEYGTVLCLRAQTTRYTYETKISNVNDSFKGLTMYGDNKNLVAIGIAGNRIEMKSVENGVESILFRTLPEKGTPHFRIDVERGRFLTCYYGRDGESWFPANDTPLDVTSLVPWDRVARPGLIHIGESGAPAEIDYFVLKNEKECSTFEEMRDSTNDTLSDWTAVPKGLQASFVTIDDKLPKSRVPRLPLNKSVAVAGWKGERVSAQLLLWSAGEVRQVEIELNDFAAEGAQLPASVAQARFVRYVMTDEFGPGCGHRQPGDFPASLAPDMLDNLECFDMEAKSVRPVWLTFSIPSDAVAGNYKGKLKLYAEGHAVEDFEIALEVVDRLLPAPSEWGYHLDLWQHPSAVARVHNLEVWSDAHFEQMQPLMKMLADAGQKVITATLNKDPWNNQCYDAYADMIVWTRNSDRSWTFDYTVFDRWVQFMMDLGIDRMINCYSLLTWNNQLHYHDEEKGGLVTLELKAQSEEYAELWGVFLEDFTRHLRDKGWLEKTNIAMDERAPADMKAALRVLESAAPELGVSLADNHKSYREYPWIKDICVGVGNKVSKEEIAARRAKGLITTYYVCCADKFPNMFTFSPPAESVYAAWYAAAAGFDGFLRWAYNSWVENPLTDSRFRTWPAGDTYMVYPGARSSVRFERLREGIQDVEKIRLLRRQYSEENSPASLAKLSRLNDAVAYFNTLEPSADWQDRLNDAKKLLNE